jgi:hypothetical protein
VAIVGVVFLAVNLPFIIWHPVAWFEGALLPFRSPLIPDGQGLVTLALHGVARGVSLPLLTVSGTLVLVALLLAFVVWYPAMKRIWMLLLPMTFFVAPRSLSTYLLDLLPAALVAAVSVAPAPAPAPAPAKAPAKAPAHVPAREAGPAAREAGPAARSQRPLRPAVVAVLAVTVASVVVAVVAFFSAPLGIDVQSVTTSAGAAAVESVTVVVHNRTGRPVVPHFMVDIADTHPAGFWYPAHHRSVVIGPHDSSQVTLYPTSYIGSPEHGSHWLVEAFTSTPGALSTSVPQVWRLGRVQ